MKIRHLAPGAVLAVAALLPASAWSATLVTSFYLKGDATDVAGTTNGSAVTPAVNLSGANGVVGVTGTGSVNFVPMQVGNGVKFLNGGQQQYNSAFYRFTGPTLANIFNSDEGEMTFYLKSSYSWTERKAQPILQDRYVMHVYDYSTRDLFQFSTYIYNTWLDQSQWTLKFVYRTGGNQDDYAIAHGQEDVVFGKNVVVKVRLTWTATQHSLYLNDQLVRTSASTKLTPNWQNDAIFTFGSQAAYNGGFFASDDAIDEFVVKAPGVTVPDTVTTRPTTLQFGAIRNGGTLIVTPTQTVTVDTTGAPAPSWTASSNQSWLQITGGSGAGAGTFTAAIINPGDVIGSQTSLNATITITSPTATTVQIPVTLTVDQTGSSTSAAFGQVDTPAQNATGQQGAIGITGWALDDLGVMTVKIYRSCMPFEPQGNCQTIQNQSMVFVGDAAFLAGARPDVEAAFPTMPYNYRGGWGMQILSNMLPHVPNSQLYGGQGTLNLYAVATDVEGHVTLLGRSQLDSTPTTVTMDNDNIAKPFGTADTPVLGSTVSGTFAAFVWALTPANAGPQVHIDPSGSTMVMYIDGNATATAVYNQCRGTVGNLPINTGQYCNDDVANVFGNIAPQPPLTTRTANPSRFRNLDVERGAIAANTVNTTTLSNGLHTIAWGVTDTANRGDGIGSRFFTVLNASNFGAMMLPQLAAELVMADVAPVLSHGAASSLDALPVSNRFVSYRKGFDASAPGAPLPSDSDGVRAVTLATQNRLEITLGGATSAGYLIASGELRDLPVGSTLDAATGVFSWVPPPMYFGTYRLVFVIDNTRVIVDVTIGS